ncbi:MAG TPA: peptidoglycan editing factor PgeF [Planktothrix sp.]
MTNSTRAAIPQNRWQKQNVAGLPLLMSPLLAQQEGLIHAFTTRAGGQSKAPMQSFNLGRHIDDTAAREDAMANRERLCQALGADYSALTVPGQVHSNRVVSAEEKSFSDVDSVATNLTGVPILLHFADCVPIIIYDPKARAIAVVHAGWKGTAASIVKNAVKFLSDNYGSKPVNLVAAVGPAIGPCCYPTAKEVADKLAATASGGDTFIQWHEQPRPDLKGLNAAQLSDLGVEKIDVTEMCTACEPAIFYSHRQSGGKTGRQGAIAFMQNL